MEDEKNCREVLGRSAPIGRFDRNKINQVGSSVALGHPFAATGARITGTLAKLLSSGEPVFLGVRDDIQHTECTTAQLKYKTA